MPSRRPLLRVLGVLALFLAVGTLAVLTKPEWREYFVEAGSILGVVVIVRATADGMRSRFLTERSSPFERALRRESTRQRTPSQLLSTISMAAAPEKPTFDLLALAADHRLKERHNIGLEDAQARVMLGSEVFDLLHATRRSGPTWKLRKKSPRFFARLKEMVPFVGHRLSAPNPRNTPDFVRSSAVEEVRTILTRLEQL